MEDYFHLNIDYVVNVTDIDDKIIRKANLTFLTELIKEQNVKFI
jgi:cysteinyl-tRNA synthetase